MVKAGYFVLVPDRRGFGELQPINSYISPSCGRNKIDGRILLEHDAVKNFQTSLRAMDVNDMIIAIEYLDKREDIKDIAMIGLSGGGVVASYVAGLNDKIKCLVLSNSFSYLKALKSNLGFWITFFFKEYPYMPCK